MKLLLFVEFRDSELFTFRNGENISAVVGRDLHRILDMALVILNTHISFFSVISRDCKLTAL